MNADNTSEITAYSYRPSLLGAAWEFKLTDDGLDWAAGRKSGHVRFRDVRRLRLSYRPTGMQSHRFMTELWAEGVPKLKIVSTTWKSMVEQVPLDQQYAAFVGELHRRIAPASPAARFERGSHPLLYWPGLIVFAGMAIVLVLLIVRALQADASGGAAFVGIFLLLLLWQGGNFFRRNRPRVYLPEAPPADLLPKG